MELQLVQEEMVVVVQQEEEEMKLGVVVEGLAVEFELAELGA